MSSLLRLVIVCAALLSNGGRAFPLENSSSPIKKAGSSNVRTSPFHKEFQRSKDLSSVFDEWTIRCVRQAFAECIVFQKRVDGKTGKILFWAEFSRNQYAQETVLAIVVPSELDLNLGVTVQIDGIFITSTAFSQCYPEGCLARVKLDQASLGRILGGRLLQAVIMSAAHQPVGFAMPMTGLPQAHHEMLMVFSPQNLSRK